MLYVFFSLQMLNLIRGMIKFKVSALKFGRFACHELAQNFHENTLLLTECPRNAHTLHKHMKVDE